MSVDELYAHLKAIAANRVKCCAEIHSSDRGTFELKYTDLDARQLQKFLDPKAERPPVIQ